MSKDKATKNPFEDGFEDVRHITGPVPIGEHELRVMAIRYYESDVNGERYEVPHVVLSLAMVNPLDRRHLTVALRYSDRVDITRFKRKVQGVLKALGLSPANLTDGTLRRHVNDGGPVGRIIRARVAPNFVPARSKDGEFILRDSYEGKPLTPFQKWDTLLIDDVEVEGLWEFRHNYSLIAIL